MEIQIATGTLVAAVISAVASDAMFARDRTTSPPVVLAASLLTPLLIVPPQSVTILLVLATVAFTGSYWVGYVKGISWNTGDTPPCEAAPTQSQIKVWIWMLAAIAWLAFTANITRTIRTLGILAYATGNAKDIELVFGASTLINYAFFLNVNAAALATWAISTRRISRGYWVLVGICTTQLVATGIKSTFVFGALVVLFVWMLTARPSKAVIGVWAGIFGFAIIALFAFVNIGFTGEFSQLTTKAIEAIRGYVVPNYQNLALELDRRTAFTWGKYTLFFVTKLVTPGVRGYFDTGDFLLINRDNNMGTVLREFWADFGLFGITVVPLILGSASGAVFQHCESNRSYGRQTLRALVLTACTFAFFGNQFIRLQFIFWAFIALLFDYQSSRSKEASARRRTQLK